LETDRGQKAKYCFATPVSKRGHLLLISVKVLKSSDAILLFWSLLLQTPQGFERSEGILLQQTFETQLCEYEFHLNAKQTD